jgi:DNA-binding MarR family transcriptional regulator
MKHAAPKQALPDLECACATARRTARLVTVLYSQEMGGRMEPAQFSLLTALARMQGGTQSALGRVLGLDKTTVSRNLLLLKRNGWIEPAASDDQDDQRERGYRLTPSGKTELAATRPGWKRAQRKLRTALQPGEWERMFQAFDRLAAAARQCVR